MISKVFDGHSFYHACRYVSNKQEATIIAAEGVREYSYQLMAKDFIDQAAHRPTKKQACFHAALSFHPTEKPEDDKLVTIAKEYLEGIGITNTQFAIAKHTDRKHLHLHIIANIVNNEGRSIKDNYIGLRGKKVAQQLTLKHDLVQSEKKDLKLTNLEALHESEGNRYKIYMACMIVLPQCRTLEDLETGLKNYNIDMLYKFKGDTQERQGVSFRLGSDVFKGSKVDRNLSLGGMEKILSAQQKQDVTQELKPTAFHVKQATAAGREGHRFSQTGRELVAKAIESASSIQQSLFKAEQGSGGIPNELLHDERKKKHRHKPGI